MSVVNQARPDGNPSAPRACPAFQMAGPPLSMPCCRDHYIVAASGCPACAGTLGAPERRPPDPGRIT
jgi:hypothetical protein